MYKRQFGLAAEIIAIVIGSLMLVFGILYFVTEGIILYTSGIISLLLWMYASTDVLFIIWSIVTICFGIALIVIGSLLCSAKRKASRRTGLGITLCILLGITCMNYVISNGIGFIISVAAVCGLTFEIISLSTGKGAHSVGSEYYRSDGSVIGASNPASRETVDMRSPSPAIRSASYPGVNESLDAKLADLKKLYQMDVIDKEQFRKAVDRLVNNSLGLDEEFTTASSNNPDASDKEGE